jgi:cytochrome P450
MIIHSAPRFNVNSGMSPLLVLAAAALAIAVLIRHVLRRQRRLRHAILRQIRAETLPALPRVPLDEQGAGKVNSGGGFHWLAGDLPLLYQPVPSGSQGRLARLLLPGAASGKKDRETARWRLSNATQEAILVEHPEAALLPRLELWARALCFNSFVSDSPRDFDSNSDAVVTGARAASLAQTVFAAEVREAAEAGVVAKEKGKGNGAAGPGCFVVWYGRYSPCLVLCDPALVRSVLRAPRGTTRSDDHADAFVKGYEDEFRPWLGGDSILLARGHSWYRKRRLCAPAFQSHRLEHAFQCCLRGARALVERIASAATADAATGTGRVVESEKDGGSPAALGDGGALLTDQGGAIDLHGELVQCGLEIIGQAAMGVDFSRNASASDGEDSPSLLRDFETALTEIEHRSTEVVPLPESIYLKFTARGKRFQGAVTRLRSRVGALIAARRAQHANVSGKVEESRERDGDLLDILLRSPDNDGDEHSEAELCEDMMTFLFAGHETTSIASFWTLLLISRHPSIEKRCLDEIRSVFRGREPGTLTQLDYAKLKFVGACISEGMRLFPPQPASSRTAIRDTWLEYDDERDPIFVPEGCDISVVPWLLHRNELVWERAAEFDPDRWLTDTPVGFGDAKRHKYAYVPFSAGKRVCIGRPLALVEARVIISNLLSEFEFEWSSDLGLPLPVPAVTLRPTSHQVRVRRRAAES